MQSWAVVTGASGGIGREIARELAARGHALILTARSGEALAQLADELRREHDTPSLCCVLDLGLPGGAEALMQRLAAAGITPDILVNNAGIGVYGPFAEADPERLQAVIDLNVSVLTRLTSLMLPGMLRLGHGRILNVSSTAAFQPGPGMAVYFATKAYVQSLSEALDAELRRRGITVTALCPGATATGFQTRAAGERAALFHGHMDDARMVARCGVKAMLRGRRVVVAGARNRWLVLGGRLAPRRLVTAVTAWLLRET